MLPRMGQFSATRSILNEDELASIEARVLKYLATHESIANRDIREMANIGYDQTGKFLTEMIERGVLRRVGSNSQTRYTLPD